MTYRHEVNPFPRCRALALAACLALVTGVMATPANPALAADTDPAFDPATSPALASFYDQQAQWGPCADRSSRVQCATVSVPMDYRDPGKRSLSIALLRVPATGTSRGSLVVNPGGPGAGGLDFAEYLGSTVDPAIRDAFDIVGFDPRGVGASAPITCLTGKQTSTWYRTDPTPDTAKEVRTLWRRAAAISDGCIESDPQLARNVGTENTVSDMDIIRAAIGDESLNWFGFSYGTTLGALYAQQFPTRVGRMVLDGGVDPQLNAMQVSKDQSAGFQRAIDRFAADCARRDGCVADSATGVIRAINSILRRLEQRAMPTDGSRRLVQGEAITALFFSMYSTGLWPTLRTGLRQAERGDGTTLQLLAQLANDQTGPNRYGSNIASAFYAIGCWDYPATPGIAGLRTAARQWSQGASVPEMAKAMSWGNAPCSNWFAHSSAPPQAVFSTTKAPILVIGTTFDPATPYAWSEALVKQLPTSRLLTHRGDGHTVYGDSNQCIDSIADEYLLTGKLPQSGTTCTS